MKGCPLKCAWCSNPESQKTRPEIMFYREKCLGCGACLEACPNAAAAESRFPPDPGGLPGLRAVRGGLLRRSPPPGGPARHGGGSCCRSSPATACSTSKAAAGSPWAAGEPTLQAGFVFELLAACRREGLHTALETCGFAPWRNMAAGAAPRGPAAVRHQAHGPRAAPRAHRGGQRPHPGKRPPGIAGRVGEMVVRFPLIPGCNNDEAEISTRSAASSSEELRRVQPSRPSAISLHRRVQERPVVPGLPPDRPGSPGEGGSAASAGNSTVVWIGCPRRLVSLLDFFLTVEYIIR